MILNPILLGLVGLRSSGLALAMTGQSRASEALYTFADMLEAGSLTDQHMAMIAAKLRERDLTLVDWADVTARIVAGSDRLQGQGTQEGRSSR